MKSIVVLLGVCSLATAALAHQAQSLQPGLQRQPLTLSLAADDAPTWNEVVHRFSDQLQAAYRLDGTTGDAFAEWIMDASDLHSVPADLLAALINTESNFRINVKSRLSSSTS